MLVPEVLAEMLDGQWKDDMLEQAREIRFLLALLFLLHGFAFVMLGVSVALGWFR